MASLLGRDEDIPNRSSRRFDGLLEELTSKPTMTLDKTKLKEKTTTIEINTEKILEQINFDFLFNYKIFPSNIMTFITQKQGSGTQATND